VDTGLLTSVQCRADQIAQSVQGDRFGQIVERASFERSDRVVGTAIGGEHRDRHLRMPCRNLLDQLQAQAVRQTHVGQAQCVGFGRQKPASLLETLRTINVQAHTD